MVAKSPAETRPRFLPYAVILFLVVLWFILCRHLSSEWSINEQYSYGWFVPFFAAYLFWLRWETRPEADGYQLSENSYPHNRQPITNTLRLALATAVFLLMAALLPLRLFEVGNPDWRPLGWLHAAIVVAVTLFIVWRVGGATWLKHFAFPVCFIFVAIPWVTPIEEPIVQGLMRVVAAIACETINLLGIPAQLEGSVIRINSGVVGVNEACSGVRSLQTSLMIGLLFGELKRLSFARRLLLLTGAVAIAFLANCARAFFLVWIAAVRGISAVGQWHDVAGYAILGAVFAGTMGIAALLARGSKISPTEDSPPRTSAPASSVAPDNQDPITSNDSSFLLPASYFVLSLAWLLVIEAAVETWYRSHDRQLVAGEQWSVRWPANAQGFRQIPINDEVKAMLRFDEGRQVAWPLPNDSRAEAVASAMLFFFRWEPGSGTILRARSHRPDICLPSVGWRQTGDYGVRNYAADGSLALPFRHFAFAIDDPRRGKVVAEAFFCLREDKVRSGSAGFDVGRMSAPEWDRADRLRVVREGLRNPGQQVIELVLIGKPDLTPALAETRFAALLPELVSLKK